MNATEITKSCTALIEILNKKLFTNITYCTSVASK